MEKRNKIYTNVWIGGYWHGDFTTSTRREPNTKRFIPPLIRKSVLIQEGLISDLKDTITVNSEVYKKHTIGTKHCEYIIEAEASLTIDDIMMILIDSFKKLHKAPTMFEDMLKVKV